jgi:hypothetical protein
VATILDPLVELFNGKAFKPHPGDAALPLGKRFAGQVIVVVGGGPRAWTQRVCFDGQGQPALTGPRSLAMKRGSTEWGQHLKNEAALTAGWAVLLAEQWQAAFASASAASVGGNRVEKMLRVREHASQFGDERISDDAVRVAFDHPSMDTSVVVGVRATNVEQGCRDLVENGFQIAAVRVAVLAYLERHLAALQREQQALERTIVATDGQSALIVGVCNQAFDTTEGGISYCVNRPSDLSSHVLERITKPERVVAWGGKIDLIGPEMPWSAETLPAGIDLRQLAAPEPALCAVDGAVFHDFRIDLEESRGALPAWMRPAFLGVFLLVCACLFGLAFQLKSGLYLEGRIGQKTAEATMNQQAAGAARKKIEGLKKEEKRAQQIGAWLENTYHAQNLVHSFLKAIPADVALDGMEITAAEGTPQLKLKFTLVGNEDSLAIASRAIETRLYELQYEIAQRDDPVSAAQRRGGVTYGWTIIMPTFGSS